MTKGRFSSVNTEAEIRRRTSAMRSLSEIASKDRVSTPRDMLRRAHQSLHNLLMVVGEKRCAYGYTCGRCVWCRARDTRADLSFWANQQTESEK